MRNFLNFSLLLVSMGFYSQTYCIPAFDDGCDDGDQIDSFTIPSASFSHLNSGCSSNAYGDFTSQTIYLSAASNYAFTIEHNYDSQHVRIWIDFNNDGVFTDAAPELVAATTASPANTTTGTIVIPAGTALGNYRMRVGDRFNNDPIPCNIDGYGEVHDYTVNIAAPPTCLPPSNLTSSAITTNSATISWVASTSTVGVGYEYYLSTNNVAPTNTTIATGNVASIVTTVDLTTLSPSTNYYIWVRAICSTTDKSVWSFSHAFATQCSAVTPTYTNNFTVFPGVCWTQASDGTPSTGSTGTDSNWYSSGFLNNGSTGSAVINLYFYDTISWLKSNIFNLSAGGYRVKFDYGLTEFEEVTASPMGSDDVIQLLISNDGGTTWTILHTWNAANAPSNVSTPFSLDLTTYNSANTVFAFFGSDGPVNDSEDYEFFVDNFVVESINLSTSEINSTKDKIKIYPNPFTDVLTISDVKNVQSISIIDLSGRVVKTIDKPTSNLQVGDLNSGVYMVVLSMKDGTKQSLKAIKK